VRDRGEPADQDKLHLCFNEPARQFAKILHGSSAWLLEANRPDAMRRHSPASAPIRFWRGSPQAEKDQSRCRRSHTRVPCGLPAAVAARALLGSSSLVRGYAPGDGSQLRVAAVEVHAGPREATELACVLGLGIARFLMNQAGGNSSLWEDGGAEEGRTPDFLNAKSALAAKSAVAEDETEPGFARTI